MKSISFRFDVDTDLCFSVGVPNLIRLAEKNGCQFTFYINVGRAIDYRSIFKPKATDKNQSACALKLTAFEKFGIFPVINFLIRNRLVADDKEAVKKLLNASHEIGLHGGINHAVWHRYASLWDKSRLEREIQWGVDKFISIFGFSPKGFSSPGWNSPEGLSSILKDMKFQYFADLHGEGYDDVSFDGYIPNAVTQLTGEPGGVGYLEHIRALRLNNKDAVDYFMSNVRRHHQKFDHVIVYDHPGFCGVKGFGLMNDILNAVVSEGIVTLRIDEYLRSIKNR